MSTLLNIILHLICTIRGLRVHEWRIPYFGIFTPPLKGEHRNECTLLHFYHSRLRSAGTVEKEAPVCQLPTVLLQAMLTVGAIKRCQVLQTLTGCAAATFGGRPGSNAEKSLSSGVLSIQSTNSLPLVVNEGERSPMDKRGTHCKCAPAGVKERILFFDFNLRSV
jgi:hypothetical protein